MLAPQLDRFTAARQVAADGPSEIDHRAAPGRRAPAAGAITDGAGEALGNPLGLRRLFRGDERAQIGPGKRITPVCDQPTCTAPVRGLSVRFRVFAPAHYRRSFFARQRARSDRAEFGNRDLEIGENLMEKRFEFSSAQSISSISNTGDVR